MTSDGFGTRQRCFKPPRCVNWIFDNDTHCLNVDTSNGNL